MKVNFFNVGLGDCSLFMSGNETLLIDGGAWCCDDLKLLIKKENITKIDHVICTHAHEDHVDGLAELNEIIPFGKVYSNISSFPKSKAFTKLAQKNQIEIPMPGDIIEFGNAKVTFLSPGNNPNYVTGNDRSLTCLVEEGKRILMCADVSSRVLEDCIEAKMEIVADIIKIPHHGLAVVQEKVLEKINPKHAVISYGKSAGWEMSSDLLDLLGKRKVNIHRTDRMGNIVCEISEDRFWIGCEKEYIRDKKVLILGANEPTYKFVDKAKELGIYTFVTDNRPNSAAKKRADSYFDIDGKDIEQLLEKVEKYGIDGVVLGAADPLTEAYMQLCLDLDVPCFLKPENLNFFINKERFKTECKSVGLSVIDNYFVGTKFYDEDRDVAFPCIVKPAVGRGGKGVRLCKQSEDLKAAFEYAQKYSDNGVVIIEKYMKFPDISVYYFICDGAAHLIAVSDRKTMAVPGKISAVTYGNHYPSKHTESFKEQCDTKMKRLFRNLGIQNGFLEIQVFWDGENFYPYDPCCVLGGEFASPIFTEVLKIDLIASYLRFAITGSMNCYEFPCEDAYIPDNRCAESVWILLRPGKIKSIEGMEEIGKMPGVIGWLSCLKEGDEISEEFYGTEKSVLMRIWLSAENEKELEKRVQAVRARVRVVDTDGRDMIVML